MDKYFARKFILRKNPGNFPINEYLTFDSLKQKPHRADGAIIFKRWLQPESLIKMIPPGQDHGFSPGRLTGKVEKDFSVSVAKINKSINIKAYKIKNGLSQSKSLKLFLRGARFIFTHLINLVTINFILKIKKLIFQVLNSIAQEIAPPKDEAICILSAESIDPHNLRLIIHSTHSTWHSCRSTTVRLRFWLICNYTFSSQQHTSN